MIGLDTGHLATRLAAAALLAALAGCAGQPERGEALAAAQQAYRSATEDPQVAQHAAVPLYEAQQALDRAREAESMTAQEHYAYLAQRRVDLARAEAEQRRLGQEIQQLAEQRDRMLLRAREAELAALESRRSNVVTLRDVLFGTGQAALKPGADEPLDRIAAFLAENPNRSVRIEGHTDSVGSAAYNQRLSRARAESVKSALIGRGVEPERIETVGLGEAQPIADNDNPGGRQLNRRVEVVILGERGG